MPRVSVIVPVRDRRGLLGNLLAALDRQTYADLEVVVADDGSVDGSGDLAEATTVLGHPVRVLRLAGRGAVAARTAAVAVAAGELLAFTDSDCEPEPGWLAHLVAEADAGADVVVGRTVPARAVRPLERSVHAGDDGLFATCNVLYRRAAFDAVGGFASTIGRWDVRPNARARGLGIGEDTILGWRVAQQGTLRVADGAVVRHAVHPPDLADSITRGWMAAAFPALLREVPELGGRLLRRRVLLGGTRRLPLLAAVLLLGVGPRWLAAGALGWWAAARVPELRSGGEPIQRWPATLGALLAVDVATEAGLLVGSVRARRLVL